MLSRVDRIQLTTHNADTSAERWCQLLDCAHIDNDVLDPLNAKRITLQLGDSLVELLEPQGPGLAQSHLELDRGGPFSAGVTTDDMPALRRHLSNRGINGLVLGEQLLLDETESKIPGLRILVSPDATREPIGLMKNLYEVTHLTLDAPRAIADFAQVFGLNADNFVPIHSDQYGYDGALTLFNPNELHRIEIIHPFAAEKTMGRFLQRFGPSLYMCYAETDNLGAVRERLKSLTPKDWTGSDEDNDGLFIHPKALDGVMLGVSRTTHAWTWSGSPERRLPV